MHEHFKCFFFVLFFFLFFFQFSSFGSLLLHVTNVFILSSCYIYFINFKIVYSLELHTKFRSNHRGNIFSVFFFRDYMISSKINQTKEKQKNSITRVFRSSNYIVWRNYALFLHPLRRQFLYHLKCVPFKNQFTENKRKKKRFRLSWFLFTVCFNFYSRLKNCSNLIVFLDLFDKQILQKNHGEMADNLNYDFFFVSYTRWR